MAVQRDRVTAVMVEIVDREYGLWCNRCMLPSAAVVHIAMSLGERTTMHRRMWCFDCDSGDHVTRD